MGTPDPITGKVAAIIDDTTLVLNVGSLDGVREAQLFAIISVQGEVSDPDTGDSLGQWEAVKGRVVVTHVQERMATVRSPLLEDSGQSTGILSAMMVRHSFGLYGERERERERLEVHPAVVSGRPRMQPIEVGDAVRSISLEALAEAADAQGGTPDLPSESYATSPPPAETDDAG